jgi:hypothetical protein
MTANARSVGAVQKFRELFGTAQRAGRYKNTGPERQYSIIGTIPDRGQTTIIGCIRDGPK